MALTIDILYVRHWRLFVLRAHDNLSWEVCPLPRTYLPIFIGTLWILRNLILVQGKGLESSDSRNRRQ